jgi:hypothetical protein
MKAKHWLILAVGGAAALVIYAWWRRQITVNATVTVPQDEIVVKRAPTETPTLW